MSSRWFWMTMFVLFVGGIVYLINNPASEQKALRDREARLDASVTVNDYGNGVYYISLYTFDDGRPGYANFGKHLAKFIGDHPDLRVTAIAGTNECANHNGIVCGYYIITEKR